MADRYRYRGRYVSPSALAGLSGYIKESYEVGQRGKRVQQERIEQPEPPPPPPPPPPKPKPPAYNWNDEDTQRAIIRSAGGSPLSDDAFQDMPDGTVDFQVRFIMPDNPDYPRGWASYSRQTYDEWERIDQILKEGEEKGASGVGAIVFYR